MVGAIAATFIAIWFFKTARRLGKEPIQWLFTGLASYYLPAILWTFMVTPPLRDMVEHNQSILLAWFVRFAYVVIGVLSAVWVKKRILDRSR